MKAFAAFAVTLCIILPQFSTRRTLLSQSASNRMSRSAFAEVKGCRDEVQCRRICGVEQSEKFPPLCDRNGTCICDCTDKDFINQQPVPEPCSTWISSLGHDRCGRYCTGTYARPYKLCGDTKDDVVCACLCKWY